MKRLTAILTAALIMLTAALPVMAEPEESGVEETSITETSTEESGTEETSAAETSAEESGSEEASTAETSAEESGTEASEASHTSSDESGAAETSTAEEKITMKPYRIEEAKLDISVPSVMSVITRDTKANDPVFEENRTTKEECDKNFAENDIYLRANTKDFSCSVSVVVNETEDTQKIGNLSSLSEELIQTIISKIQESPIYTGCARVTYNNVLFLSFTIAYDSEGTKVHGLQEYTIIDGKCVKITYQTAASEENDPNKALFGQIMETVTFDGITVIPADAQEKEPSVSVFDIDIRYIYIMIAAAIGVISLMIIILVGIKYNQSKQDLEEDVLEYDDGSDEDDSEADDGPSENAEDSKDIYSDTGKKKEPSVEAKPMTYDDVISAKGNFSAKDLKTSESPEKENETDKNDDQDSNEDLHEEKNAEIIEDSEKEIEPLFIIDMDEGDVPQAPLKWDDIPEGALDRTLQPALDELKRESLQEKESYKRAWNAAKAARMARAAQEMQNANIADNANSEKSAASSKGEKTSKAAKADKNTKQQNSENKDIPVTESTIEIPELSNAPEYVPITGPEDTDALNDTQKEKPSAEEKQQSANESISLSEPDQSDSDADSEKTKNLPNGDVPKDMKNFFKFNKQKDNTESVNNVADYEGASMKNVIPMPPEDKTEDDIQDNTGTFEFYTRYGQSDAVADSEYEKRFGNNMHTDAAEKTAPEIQAPPADADTPASAAAAAVESAVLAGMIDRLRTTNDEVNRDIEQNGNNLTGEKLLNDVAGGETKTENSIYNAQEEKKPQKNAKSGSIELEISKAADGSLVIGAKNDANGQPMDIEIRDASHFKEDRDKEMAAMGLETASDNEIYNAWKIENEENPFIVKTISEVEAEENTVSDNESQKAENDMASDKTENTEKTEKTEKTEAVSDNEPEKTETSDKTLTEESELLPDTESDDEVEAMVAVLDPSNLLSDTKSDENTSDTEETTDKPDEQKSDAETAEEFFEGVKSAAPLEAGGIDPKEQQPEKEENLFEKESGIIFERPSEYQPPIVPMHTPFTRVPRLETVNAEEYHKEYEELKKTLPKNQFYAQRFSSANITQPFVETPKPITSSNEAVSEQSENIYSSDSSEKPEKHFGRKNKNKNKQKEKPARTQDDGTFEYYTGYEETDDPFSVQNPDEELLIKDHKKKSGDSFGSKFKKSFSSIFSNDIPDE